MKLYRYDQNGIYAGSLMAEVNRRATARLGVTTYFSYPSTTVQAPPTDEVGRYRWDGYTWKAI